MGRIWDISLTIGPQMLGWPGDPRVSVEPALSISRGDPAKVSRLQLGSHTGTHVDPPAHFIPGGACSDALPLEALLGDAVVVEMAGSVRTIGAAELDAASRSGGLAGGDVRVLFKTANSAHWQTWSQPGAPFPEDYVALSPEGAAWLVSRGVRLVGVDFLSVEPAHSPGQPTHMALLAAGVVILEGLNLATVAPGRYQLACLPLKIGDGDGAPARAVLIEP